MKGHSTERGQVLIIIILSAVVLFGFAALAVDGGRVYAERRRAQNAADASALAAAYASIEKKDWSLAAMNQAIANGYNDSNPAQQGGIPVDVHVHNPPISGPYQGNKDYFQVFIRNHVDQVFSQFVFQGRLEVTVEAVARARGTDNVFPGQALVAVNHAACRAVQFSGNGDTTIIGGNVFSNSGGTGNCPSGQQNGSGSITVQDGEIIIAGDWDKKGGSGSVSPLPTPNAGHLELPDLPVPDCDTGVPARDQNDYKDTKVLEPGRYTGIKITNGDWTMKKGMYCFTSTGFDFNGGSLIGYEVFLVALGGDIKINGNGKTDLIRADAIKDGSGNQWGGMLIYMPASNTGGIDLNGGSYTNYTGTILAPGPRASNKPKCTISGNSGSIGLSANVICDTVEIGGTADVVVNYKSKENWRMPPIVDLSQ